MAKKYTLDIEAPKKNVFVTQLHERENENDEARYYPIVGEAADKLIDMGVNTMQKTLLLKQMVEYERADDDLKHKRGDFKHRMEACGRKQAALLNKQTAFKTRVSKFERFISENELKRRRAIQKFYAESKAKESKAKELELLGDDCRGTKVLQERLMQRLTEYKKFEQFLLKVIEALPPNYIEATDNMITGLVMRHQTLNSTNSSLLQNLEKLSDELKTMKVDLETLKEAHSRQLIKLSQELAAKKKHEEELAASNHAIEQRSGFNHNERRTKIQTIGQMTMAIDNLVLRCLAGLQAVSPKKKQADEQLNDPELLMQSMNWEDKLDVIRTYMQDREWICRKAESADLFDE